MSALDDPRVLFAAERTLLAWSRTAAGLMALGFFVDRASLVDVAGGPHRKFAAWIGVAFLLLGVVLSISATVWGMSPSCSLVCSKKLRRRGSEATEPTPVACP